MVDIGIIDSSAVCHETDTAILDQLIFKRQFVPYVDDKMFLIDSFDDLMEPIVHCRRNYVNYFSFSVRLERVCL